MTASARATKIKATMKIVYFVLRIGAGTMAGMRGDWTFGCISVCLPGWDTGSVGINKSILFVPESATFTLHGATLYAPNAVSI
jgi:hypothetical protein